MNQWVMHPAEQIAKDTWGRLKQSRELRTRLGEVTLTDLLVLDFVRFMDGRARLFQSTNKQESIRGTDLEIRIHAGCNRAVAFALQAKKLYPDERYRELKTTVKSSNSLQLEILEDYAESVCAVPLYLLYNYVCWDDLQPCWHCRERFSVDIEQLGCTVVPSRIIRRAICKRGRRNFDWIHKSCAALPWRCLFDCPHQCTQRYDCEYLEPVYGGWPDWLWSRNSTTFSDEDVERLQREIRRHDVQAFTPHIKDKLMEHSDEIPGYLILVKETRR